MLHIHLVNLENAFTVHQNQISLLCLITISESTFHAGIVSWVPLIDRRAPCRHQSQDPAIQRLSMPGFRDQTKSSAERRQTTRYHEHNINWILVTVGKDLTYEGPVNYNLKLPAFNPLFQDIRATKNSGDDHMTIITPSSGVIQLSSWS